jgi:hypothetical protein
MRPGLDYSGYVSRENYNLATYNQPDMASLDSTKPRNYMVHSDRIVTPGKNKGGWGYVKPENEGDRDYYSEKEHTVPRRQSYRASTKTGEATREASSAAASGAAASDYLDSRENQQRQNYLQDLRSFDAKLSARREAIRTRDTYEPADRGALFEAENTGWSAHVKHERGNLANRQERTYGAADYGMASDAVDSWEQNRATARDADRFVRENNAMERADASNADSHATPPSVPLEQKTSRGRIRRTDRNIQAFY